VGSVRVRVASVVAAARGRYFPHGTRRRARYRAAALVLLALCVLVPLGVLAYVVGSGTPVGRAILLIAFGLVLPLGALVAFALLDRARPGRAPWWKALLAWILSAPAVLVGVVALLVGRGSGAALAAGTVLWAEVPNDEDHGRTSKVRPVVVAADGGREVLVRWFTTQDKSRRGDFVQFSPAQQKACGLDGVGHSTWLSTETMSLRRAALREPVGAVPADLLRRRPV